MSIDLGTIQAERERLKRRYLRPGGERRASSARGVHHVALLSSDVERTIRFYQELLELPLTEIFENRDYPGSRKFIEGRGCLPRMEVRNHVASSQLTTAPGARGDEATGPRWIRPPP